MRSVFSLALFCCCFTGAQTVPGAAPAGADTFTLPAGTRIALVLKSAINTKNARPGDAVYLQTNFPVAQNNHMVIPAGTYVQGVVDEVRRAGHVKGRAEVRMHFTTMIFTNGYTVALPGALENVPGAGKTHMKDKEGTVQADSKTGENAATIAGTAATGTMIGGLSQGGKGAAMGAGIGGAVGTALVLLGKGNEVRMEPGTSVEMVLGRPLALDRSRLNATAN